MNIILVNYSQLWKNIKLNAIQLPSKVSRQMNYLITYEMDFEVS